MKRALLVALATTLTGEAFATGSISCASQGGEATVEIAVGTVPGLAVVGALIEADGKQWAIGRDGATPIAVSQAFATGQEIRIDFTDGNVSTLIAELRLFRADEGRESAMAGTLRMPETGAWALVCAGP